MKPNSYKHYAAKNYLYELMGERTRRIKSEGKCQVIIYQTEKQE